jgi:hypothetical protein
LIENFLHQGENLARLAGQPAGHQSARSDFCGAQGISAGATRWLLQARATSGEAKFDERLLLAPVAAAKLRDRPGKSHGV